MLNKWRQALTIMATVSLFSACGGSGTTASTDTGGSTDTETLTVYGSSGTDASAELSLLAGGPQFLGSPTSLNTNVYAMWISLNADCSDPVEVYNGGDTPVSVDFVDNPVLFSGTPADGEYQCVILKMDDVIGFAVDDEAVTENPSCVSTDTAHEFDIFRGDLGEGTVDWKDVDGNDIAPTGTMAEPSSDIVTVFFTTDSTAVLETTAVSDQVIDMATPLTVPGQATVVFDFNDQITTESDDSGDYCWVDQPIMSFE